MTHALLDGWPVVDLPIEELPRLQFPELALHQFLSANVALLDDKIRRSIAAAAQGDDGSFADGPPLPLVQARHTAAQILTLLLSVPPSVPNAAAPPHRPKRPSSR